MIIFLILNYFTIDSTLIIYQHCILETKCIKLINSTRLFSHSIFPQSFWYQGDIIMSIVVLVAISICLILLFNNSLNPRFCIYAVHQMDGDKTVHLYCYERNGYANFNNPQNDTISFDLS